MRWKLVFRLAIWPLLLLLPQFISAQNNFSFSCARDTTIAGCSPNPCFTLRALVPDIRGLSGSYQVNPIKSNDALCNPIYSNPAIAGTTADIVDDDTYSALINIGFPFTFYGNTYTSLAISSNGGVSFDASMANGATPYGMLNNGGILGAVNGTPENLPSNLYDRAIIMAPYHDVNINATQSPTRRIQYTTIGAAPHRKWVLSFFRLSHYACEEQYQNTHQLILNESTGIIEVIIFSKEICLPWNQGRAMIGIQNFTRDQAVMVPGRRASDAPWGGVNVMEAYRFVPSAGASLLKRVELVNMAGVVQQTNSSPNVLGNGELEVLFPNFCPPPNATTSYIIRSVYASFDNPATDVIGLDTIRITRSGGSDLNASATTTPSTCGPTGTGTITVAVPAGIGTAPYQYSLTSAAGPWQPANVFNGVAGGNHTVYVRDAAGCTSTVPVTVTSSGALNVTLTPVATSCPGAANGAINISANGIPPIEWSINVDPTLPTTNWFSTSSINGLLAGTYFVNVRDASGVCSANYVSVTVTNGSTPVTGTATSAATSCAGVNNGSITVNATGAGPFQYSINNGTNWQASNVFNGLAPGNYSVLIRQGGVCVSAPIPVTVNSGNGIQAALTSTATTCAGVTNGTITVTPSTGSAPFTFTMDGTTVLTGSGATTFTGVAPGPHSITITDAAGCASAAPFTINVGTGTGFTAGFTVAPTSCNGANDGSITVTPQAPGTGPYTFVLSPGAVTQNGATSTTFNNLVPGTYSILVTDANGCQFTVNNAVVAAGAGLVITATTTGTSCPGVNNGTINVTSNGSAPFMFLLDGSFSQSSATNSTVFVNVSAGAHTISVTDANGCTSTLPVNATVPSGTGFSATATPTATTCNGATNGSILVTPQAPGTGPFTFILSPGGITQSGATNTNFTNLAAGNYTVLVRDANNCEFTTPTITVAAGPGLTATITSSATTCAGVTNGSIAVTTNGTAPFTYVLDGTNTQNSANTTFVFNNVGAGSHTVTITDALGCSTTTPLITNVATGTGYTANFVTAPTSCSGVNDGSISITPQAPGTAPFTFTLSPGGITQSDPVSTTFNNLAPGTYTVLVTDANGCQYTVNNATVTTGAGLAVTLTPTPTTCSGVNNGSISVTTNGTAPFTFILDGTVTQTSATNNTVFSGLATGLHSVTVTDANGCVTTAPVSTTITAGTGFTAVATPTNVGCPGGNNGSIVVGSINGGQSPYTFVLNGTVSQVGNTGTVFSNLTSATNYTIEITDAVGCSYTINNIAITQPPLLQATTTLQPVRCFGEANGVIDVTASGGTAPYSYSLDNISFATDKVFNVPAGTYTVYVRDANSCTIQLSNLNVTNPAALTAVLGNTTNASCLGNDGTISIVASGGTAPYSYSLNGNSPQPGSVLNADAGTHSVTVTDANGCTFQVNGINVGLTNNLTFTPMADPAPVCEGSPVQLSITSNATRYSWTPATGLSNPNASNPVARPSATTLYTVSVTLGTCTIQDDVNVTVLPAPVANAGLGTTICFGQNFQLQGSGGVTYQWSPANYLDDASSSTPNVISPATTITYALQVTDANNCTSLQPAEVTVNVTPPLRVTVTPADTVVYAGALFQLQATSIGTNYLWTPSTGLSSDIVANPVVTASQTGDVITYTVTASTDAGCSGQGTATVRVYTGPDIYVPNAFSPNNDGKNERFMPFPVGIRTLKYFRVYNRWGQLMFQTSTIGDGWDGKHALSNQPAGVYVWQVEGITDDNRKVIKRGTVTLVR